MFEKRFSKRRFSPPQKKEGEKRMLNTMALQLLGEAVEVNYLYYLGSISVYMFETLEYVAILEVQQNPSVIYPMNCLADLIQSNTIKVTCITIKDRA